MKVTFLGTGTSQGIPVIGCDCEVCQSTDPKDHRFRTSAMITTDNSNVIIDVGPDFRMQMLNNKVKDLDAVLITHEHNDHIIGLDDIRPFYFKKDDEIQYYTTEKVQKELTERFPYVFQNNSYPGTPKVKVINFNCSIPFQVEKTTVIPIRVLHGSMEVTAFRINDFLYITDASFIPPESFELMKGVKYMVINSLRKRKHHSHFNLEEATKIILELNPKIAYLTHLSHHMGKTRDIEKLLPPSIKVAYDGLTIEV